jgi:hypothetical protein
MEIDAGGGGGHQDAVIVGAARYGLAKGSG